MLRPLTYAYVLIGLVTFGAQIPLRYDICAAPASCALTYLKAPVWAAIWPVYLSIALPPLLQILFWTAGIIIFALVVSILVVPAEAADSPPSA
jgi:hypothetical protein